MSVHWITFPLRLEDRGDGCALRGVDAVGSAVVFDDLIEPGDAIPSGISHDNSWGPHAIVGDDFIARLTSHASSEERQ